MSNFIVLFEFGIVFKNFGKLELRNGIFYVVNFVLLGCWSFYLL